MKKTPFIIGISGRARAGKDTFTTIAKNILVERGFSISTYSFAEQLKLDLQELISTKLGLDVFSQKTEEKNIFRPLLVTYAEIQRNKTQGRYWLEQVDRRIQKETSDVIFITDVRFDEYEKDECFWVQHEKQGKIIHLERIGMEIPYPNKTEEANDPKIKAKADVNVEWMHKYSTDITKDEEMRKIVSDALKNLGLGLEIGDNTAKV
jgi:hypothetical protein